MHLGCERTSMAIESISKIALPTNQPQKNHLRHQEQGNLRRSAPIFTSQSLPFNRPRPIQYKLLYKDSALSLFTTSPLYVLRLRRKQSKKMWINHTLLTHWTDLFFQVYTRRTRADASVDPTADLPVSETPEISTLHQSRFPSLCLSNGVFFRKRMRSGIILISNPGADNNPGWT